MKLTKFCFASPLACLSLAILAVISFPADAQYNSETFYPTSNGPYGNPIQASDGNIYIAGSGEIVKLTPPTPGYTTSGTVTVIHTPSSSPGDGGYYENIIEGTDGNLYGVSTHGGANAEGSIFKFSRDGTYTNVYSFCPGVSSCPDGAVPTSIIQGTDGNFYGTTTSGGTPNMGTIFKVSPTGTLITLYTFCTSANCPDGANPTSGLIQATDGNFYGVTSASGPGASSPAGIVYQLTPAGKFSTIYDLNTCAASNPSTGCNLTVQSTSGPLTEGGDGNLYGLVSGLPANPQTDAVYSLAFGLSLSGTFTPLASFCYDSNVYECGTNSLFGDVAGSILPFFPGSDHYLFVANAGGGNGVGSGNGSFMGFYPTLTTGPAADYDFCNPPDCVGGLNPTSAVLQANDGTFYGTLSNGIYSVQIGNGWYPPISVTAPSNNLLVGQPAKISWTVNNPTSNTLKQCIAWLDGTRVGPAPLSGSYDYKPTSAGTHLVSLTCGGTETGLLRLFVADAPASTAATFWIGSTSAPTGTPQIETILGAEKQNGVPGIPSGTVTLKADGIPVYTGRLNEYGYVIYYASTAGISAGTYNLTVTYNGDNADTASTSAVVPFTVTPLHTQMQLNFNPENVPPNQSVQLIANVSAINGFGVIPSGTVTFTYNNITLGKATLAPVSGGNYASATLTVSDKGIPAGSYGVTAIYSGDKFCSSSNTSAGVTIQ